MSSRRLGDLGRSGLDRPPFCPSPYVSSITAQGPDQHSLHVDSDIDLQSRSTSAQDRQERKAKLDQAFKAVNLNAAATPFQSAVARSGLYVPKRSTSPLKEGTPPYQYKPSPRPEGYHISPFGSGLSPNLPVASSFSKEVQSSGHNTRQLDLVKPLPLLPGQQLPFESLNTVRAAPPRPYRSPGHYVNLDSIVPPQFSSKAPPFVLPFGQGPSAGHVYECTPLRLIQTSRAKPLSFDAQGSSTSPLLVPPYESGEYSLLKNLYILKPKPSSPKSTTKKSSWKTRLRKFSGRQVSPHRTPKTRSAIGRNRSATSPFPRPRAPTPSRGRNVSEPQTSLASPSTQEALSYTSSETASLLKKPAEFELLFSITQDRTVIYHGDFKDNEWEVEALRKRQNRTNRAFSYSGLAFQAAEEHQASSNQHQLDNQEFSETPASQLANKRGSQDSLRILATQSQGLGIYQPSARPFSFELPTSKTRQDSAATLVATPVETIVYRDLKTGYWSQNTRHPNHFRDIGASRGPRGIEEDEGCEGVSLSDRAKSESSPVPSVFFERNREAIYSPSHQSHFSQKQYAPRFPREIDLSKSYPESIAEDRRSRGQVYENVQEVLRRELVPDTPERDGRKAAHYALAGYGPTDSVYQTWNSIERGTGDLIGVSFEESVDVRHFPSPGRNFQERSLSRGRDRVRESRPVPGEAIPKVEEDPVAKRKNYQARRKAARERQARISTPFDREGSGEYVIDKFLADQRGVDGPRSYRQGGPVAVEADKSIKSPRTLSATKQGLERRQRLGAVPVQVGALVKKSHFDTVLEPNTPLKRKLDENTSRVNLRSDSSPKDLVAKFDCAWPTPKRKASRFQPTSVFPEEDLLVCLRSKTGTVKELPVTPEDKLKIKTVLQHQGGYTPSIYSGDSKESAPLFAADVCVSPLAFKKSPTPPRTNQFSPKFPFPGKIDPFRTANAFLDSFSASEESYPKMDTLQVSSALRSSTKTKAEEDARAMQKSVIESCKKAGRDPPKYVLMELIGKGSFGRVYKGKDINTTKIVAVKIIDIDESDTLNPRLADTYSEIMKEVNALKILSESKAKNINHVIEALPVGTAMWMITEYCGGGSIATLMKPTPDGLREKFIIPILREVAEAVKWVHQAGIIHRDLKCANILITEEGGVQLCDFGVAGITETALDKRSTFIGTFHWMAPELFRGSSYGKEVDIWAFGSMTYEMATGLPPNAMSGVSGMDLGTYLQTHIPRLEGENYSEGLKSIVAFCLEENPNDRPTIEDVQRHSYIYNTAAKYPSSGLSDLVKAFKLWESHGGTRKSLFAVGGAQGPSELSSTALSDDNWNFSTTPAFDLAVEQAANPEDIINVYGAKVALGTDFADETSRPNRQQQARPSRRRPPPEALAPLKAPLEKLFDPNTISNYRDNSIQHFNLQQNTASDLPLRDDSAQTSIRDTLIDLDAHDLPSGLSSFAEMDTMKPTRRAAQDESQETYETGLDFARPALSDPVDNPNRRTQDWKFPSMAPPASANPEFTRFPPLQRPNMTPAVGARPALIHHPTEPVSLPSQNSYNLAPPALASDRMSLIDLDMSIPEASRPSTADSAASQDNASANPFMWERHASMYNTQGYRSAREPSLYLDDSSMGLQSRTGNTLQEFNEVSDFSASDAEGYPDDSFNGYRARHEDQGSERYYEPLSTRHTEGGYENSNGQNRGAWNDLNSSSAAQSTALFHPLPPPPSAAVLSGTASQEEMHAESHRMFETLRTSLETFREAYENMPTRPPKNNQTASGDETGGS